jgi:hypothetical protein
LKEVAGDKNRALIIFLREEILRLLGEMPFPPYPVTAISAKRDQRDNNADQRL